MEPSTANEREVNGWQLICMLADRGEFPHKLPVRNWRRLKPEDSALHKVFEWDDKKAAEQYRLHQAQHFIRCIVVKPVENDEVKEPVRMFVNRNPTDEGQVKAGSYINYRSAFENPDSREVILRNAKHELQVFRNKYNQLKELAKVFEAIDELE